MRDRAVDIAIAATLALLPLLATGPTWLGLQWPWALEAFFVVFATFALIVVLTTRAPAESSVSHPRQRQRLVARGYLIWLIPVVAAMVIGLLERNPLDARILRIEADGLLGRLAAPMDQTADPFYSLRVGLTVVEGGLMFLLLSAILRRTPDPGRRARVALAGCLAGMTIVSVLAIVQYVTRANLHEYWERANPDLTRSHATLDDPNALASFLVLGMGLAGGVAWAAEHARGRAIAMGVAVLACAGIVTTVSRAGILAVGIAVVIVCALLPDAVIAGTSYGRLLRRATRTAVVAGAIVLAGWTVAFVVLPKHATTVAPETPMQALLQTVDPRESAATILKRRHIVWGAGVHLAATHWVTGAGLGLFPHFLATYPGSDGPENAHNYFLQVFAEAGVIGLAGLVVLLGAIALALSAAARDDRPATRRFAIGMAVGVLAFVLTWLTGHPLLTLSNQLWFATVLAVGLTVADPGVAANPGGPGGSQPGSPSVRRGRGWIALVVLVTVAAFVPRATAAIRDTRVGSHAAGVYAWEPAVPSAGWPTGTTFRWTRGRAAIREPVVGAVLLLPIFMARPDIPTQPVVVEMTVEGKAVPPLSFRRNGWHVQAFDLAALLGEDRWRSLPMITIEIVVRPPVVPSRIGPSTDGRELGIGLGVVRWSSRATSAGAEGVARHALNDVEMGIAGKFLPAARRLSLARFSEIPE